MDIIPGSELHWFKAFFRNLKTHMQERYAIEITELNMEPSPIDYSYRIVVTSDRGSLISKIYSDDIENADNKNVFETLVKPMAEQLSKIYAEKGAIGGTNPNVPAESERTWRTKAEVDAILEKDEIGKAIWQTQEDLDAYLKVFDHGSKVEVSDVDEQINETLDKVMPIPKKHRGSAKAKLINGFADTYYDPDGKLIKKKWWQFWK